MRWTIRTFGFKSHLTSQETVLYPDLTSLRLWEQLLSVFLMLVAICSLFDQSSPIKCFLIFCMTVDYSPQWPLVSVSNKRQTCMRSDIQTNSWNSKAMSWHKHSPYQSCDRFGQRHRPRALAGADRSRKSLKYGLWLSRPYSLRKRSGDWGGQPA